MDNANFAPLIDANAPPGEPLTLEKLRGMGGQPVWIVEHPDWGHWELSEDGEDYIADRDPELYGLRHDDPEGKNGLHKLGWVAYAYPPARIDREAWVPCGEACRNTCMTCDHNADELFGDADYCKDCHRYSKWQSTAHKYCERCGRPKTPKAWAEREKRLRGEWKPTEVPHMSECEDCSVCGYRTVWGHGFRFCPACGRAMTDEAVDMMLEMWKEALGDET